MDILTKCDLVALKDKDDSYFILKGFKAYNEARFDKALVYYTAASNLGNPEGTYYLARIYEEGSLGEVDLDLAYAYYKISSRKNNPASLYKLGTFYENGNVVELDLDTAIYYYTKAMSIIDFNDLDYEMYPSLMYTLAINKMKGGYFKEDIYGAYMLLVDAKLGFQNYINGGATYYKENLDKTNLLLEDKCFEIMCRNYEDYLAKDYKFTIDVTEVVDYRKYNGALIELNVSYNPNHFIFNDYVRDDVDEVKKGSIGTIVKHLGSDEYMVEFKEKSGEVYARIVVSYEDFNFYLEEEKAEIN